MASACPTTGKMGPQNISSQNNISWYAIRVQSRLAKLASAALRGKGYEEFLPTVRSQRRWSDRTKEIETLLFPGYLFCRFDPLDRQTPILGSPGVIGFVGAGKTPLAIPEKEIDAIRRIVDSGLTAEPWSFIEVGTRLHIERGPLSGLEGIVINTDKTCRLVVSVNLLQRSVAVELDREWVRPVGIGGASA
jgi:transcription antitermination factor NusG